MESVKECSNNADSGLKAEFYGEVMSCKYETEYCRNHVHCVTCEHYEIGNLTTEQLDRLVDATNFARYVNAAINYNGRLPTDEEYKKLREEYDSLKV